MSPRDGPAEFEGGPGQRRLRVGESLRHALAALLQRGDLRDPELQGRSITVTEVRMSPDLRVATCFVMPLGGGEIGQLIAALGRAAPFLRRSMAGEVRMRFMPALRFRWDKSFAASAHIESLLREVQPEPQPAQEPGPPDHDGHGI
jgi:ribosome-binding factor A